jgi:mycothiol synthase
MSLTIIQRRAGAELAEAMADIDSLLEAVERADAQRPLSDHMWLDLRQGGRPGFAGLLGWQDDHDHLVAYCQVSRGNESWSLDLVVHPHHRYEMTTIGPEMLRAAINIIQAEGGGHVHWWVFEPTPTYTSLAADIGLLPGRTLLQLRVQLPLTQSTDIETCAFRVGKDEAQWLDVNNRAFADHPEQGDWSSETLASRFATRWFKPEGLLLHHEDNQLAGFCWTKLHTDTTPNLGEIYVVAVDPAFARRGLGRALTIAGLQHLSTEGAPVGMLYVAADNLAALSLYRSLGFTTHHTQRAFVGDVQ